MLLHNRLFPLLRNNNVGYRRRRLSYSLWLQGLFGSTELLQQAFLLGFSGSSACPPCGNFLGVFRLSHDWNWCRRCHSLQPLRRLCHRGTLCRCRLIGLHLDPYYAYHLLIGSALAW